MYLFALWFSLDIWWDFPGGSDGKTSACNAGDLGSIPGLGKSPGNGIQSWACGSMIPLLQLIILSFCIIFYLKSTKLNVWVFQQDLRKVLPGEGEGEEWVGLQMWEGE